MPARAWLLGAIAGMLLGVALAPRSAEIAPSTARRKVAVALVLDRSASMTGAPLAHAVAAARRLVASLAPDDGFAIISYGSEGAVTLAYGRATPAHRRAADAALAAITAEGGTCISCGLDLAAAQLARASGAPRIVLLSDGQPTHGITDRGELANRAAQIAGQGATISAFGIGLAFDEAAMIQIAERGGGNYQFADDARDLPAMFDHELATLRR